MRFTQFERSSLLYRGGWNPAQVAFVVSILVTIISSLFGPRQGSRVVGALPKSASCRSPICSPHPFLGGVSVWGGRLAVRRDVAFGYNFLGKTEYNHIPNLLNEGGCWENQLFTQKSPVITETFGTGIKEFLSCSEGYTPCGQLDSRVRVRHAVMNGKPGIPIRLSTLLGRFGETCLGGISPALRLAPAPFWGGGYHGYTHFSAPLGWLRVGGGNVRVCLWVLNRGKHQTSQPHWKFWGDLCCNYANVPVNPCRPRKGKTGINPCPLPPKG